MLELLRKKYAIDSSEFEVTGQFPNEAGILIPITDDPVKPEIILTLRADHLNSHSGEVSFPGGKWEADDPTLVYTALRESQEEIALPPEQVVVINREPQMMSRFGIQVTPFVGIIPKDIVLEPNPEELSAIFRVPLQYFLDDNRARTEVYFRQDTEWWSPVYEFDGYKIWGLTAKILLEFLNNAFDAGLGRESNAPEVERKPLLFNK